MKSVAHWRNEALFSGFFFFLSFLILFRLGGRAEHDFMNYIFVIHR